MSTTRVYDAEIAVFGWKRFHSPKAAMALADARELIQRYVPECVVERAPRRRWGNPRSVFWHPNAAKGRPPRITLGRYAGLSNVLHEVAHAMVYPEKGHACSYRQMYVRLVRDEMSPWWARRLAAAFRKAGYAEEYEVERAA